MLPLAPSPQHIRQLAGNVYLARITGGVLGPLLHVGEVQSADSTPQVDIRKFNSHRTRKRTLVKQTPSSVGFDFALTINELAPVNLAYAFLGERSEFTQSAGTLAKTVTAKLGGYYLLGARNVSSITAEVSAVAKTGFVVVDAALGLVHIPEDSADITEGAIVDFGGTIPAIVAGSGLDQVSVGTTPSIEAQLLIVEDKDTDLQEEPSMEALFFRCAIVPNGTFPFLTQDWASFTMNVSALDDSAGLYGGSASLPYGKITFAPAA